MNIEEAKRITLADLKHEARCIEHCNAEPQRRAVREWMNSLTPEETVEWELFHAKIRIVCALNMETTIAAELEAALDEALAEPPAPPPPQTDSMRWTYKNALSGATREARGWEGLLRWLQEFTHEGEKRTAAVFAPFVGDEAQCIVLGHDDVPNWAFEKHLSDLQGLAVDAAIYTTHSHGRPSGDGTPGPADFRTVVRLSRPVDPKEYEALCHYFASHLTARADRRCFRKGCVFFAPSYPPERKDSHLFKVFQGLPYDVDAHFSKDQ